jgi:hypothetical protein
MSPSLFAAVADEGGLHEDGRHPGPHQNIERGLLQSQVVHGAVTGADIPDDGIVDGLGEFERLLLPAISGQVVDDELDLGELLHGDPVLAGGDLQRLTVGGAA